MANSRSEQISKLLKTLSTTTPDIEAAAVVDNDGLMIASALPGDVEEWLRVFTNANFKVDEPRRQRAQSFISPEERQRQARRLQGGGDG